MIENFEFKPCVTKITITKNDKKVNRNNRNETECDRMLDKKDITKIINETKF